MKRILALLWLLGCVCLISACGYEKEPQNEEIEEPTIETVETVETVKVESNLVGTWYCTRENSCNNMEIMLVITQEGNTLHFRRNMQGQSNVSSSSLEGTAEVLVPNSVYAEYVDGDYSLSDGVLKEYFKSNDRWNLYTADPLFSDTLEGSYILR